MKVLFEFCSILACIGDVSDGKKIVFYMKIVSVLSAFCLFSSQKPNIFNIQVGFDSIIHLALRLLRIFLQVLQIFRSSSAEAGTTASPTAAISSDRNPALQQAKANQSLDWKALDMEKLRKT